MLDYNYTLNSYQGVKDTPFMAASNEITASICPPCEYSRTGLQP